MRHTRSHTANRRSHHALKNMRISVSKEGTAHPRHRAILDGSMYRGRSVMDKTSVRFARLKKASKQREREEGPKKETQAEEIKKEPKVKNETKKLPHKSKEAK